MSRISDALKPMEEARLSVDSWVGGFPAEVVEQISCKSGCNHCCKQYVGVSVPEMMYIIRDKIKSPKWLASISATVKEQFEFAQKTKVGEIRSIWFAKSLPCVFRQKAFNDCQVYADRPIVCRSYFVISEPEKCAGPAIQKVQLVNNSPAIIEAWTASKKVAKEFKISCSPYPLPVALVWAVIGYQEGIGTMRRVMNRDPLVRVRSHEEELQVVLSEAPVELPDGVNVLEETNG